MFVVALGDAQSNADNAPLPLATINPPVTVQEEPVRAKRNAKRQRHRLADPEPDELMTIGLTAASDNNRIDAA